MSFTCPEENDLVLQGEVREVGDALGPFNKSEKLLVSSMAYVGDRVIRLKKRNQITVSSRFQDSSMPLSHLQPRQEVGGGWGLRPHTEFSMFISP